MKKLSVEQLGEILDPTELNEGSIFGALSDAATRFLLDKGVISGNPLNITIPDQIDP